MRWLDANEPGTRIFNRYEWGGFIGQHRPGQPIFMDGRADVYGDELLRMYVDWLWFGSLGYQHDPGSAATAQITSRTSGDNLVSREHWVGVDLDEDKTMLLRAGRIAIQ